MNTTKISFCATLFILAIAFFCLLAMAQDDLAQSQSELGKFTQQKNYSVAKSNFPKFPSKKSPLRIGEFRSMYAKINNAKTLVPKVYATYSEEDWKTQGDWYGRITPEYAILCAIDAPFDHEIRQSNQHYEVISFMGPNHDYEEAIDVKTMSYVIGCIGGARKTGVLFGLHFMLFAVKLNGTITMKLIHGQKMDLMFGICLTSNIRAYLM
jgi:hypothetical protein